MPVLLFLCSVLVVVLQGICCCICLNSKSYPGESETDTGEEERQSLHWQLCYDDRAWPLMEVFCKQKGWRTLSSFVKPHARIMCWPVIYCFAPQWRMEIILSGSVWDTSNWDIKSPSSFWNLDLPWLGADVGFFFYTISVQTSVSFVSSSGSFSSCWGFFFQTMYQYLYDQKCSRVYCPQGQSVTFASRLGSNFRYRIRDSAHVGPVCACTKLGAAFSRENESVWSCYLCLRSELHSAGSPCDRHLRQKWEEPLQRAE